MWNSSREAQRIADAAYAAVPLRKRRKKRKVAVSVVGTGFVKYADYINSKAWRAKRREAMRYHGCRCQRCGKTRCQLHVHHKTYARLGSERMQDLEILCVDCHKLEHETKGYVDSLSLEFRDIVG